MHIPETPFALDSESDMYETTTEGKGKRKKTIRQQKTRLLQWCPMDARSLDDVQVIHGWNAWNRFFDLLEGMESKKTIRIHCWNLSYEFSHMWRECLRDRYTYVDDVRPDPGCWTAVSDPRAVYLVSWTSPNGTQVRFTDDMRRFGGLSMENASRSVKAQHPDWFPMEETKLHNDDGWYKEGWLDPGHPDFNQAMEYSIQDAFSQAMVLRWLDEQGYTDKLTAPSIGLDVALDVKYDQHGPNPYTTAKWNLKRFTERYPPLNRRMQDIAEASLVGGFVYGETGTWYGSFTHVDYSSSYPYEYAYGSMFRGSVKCVERGSSSWDRYFNSPHFMKWVLVSFDFSHRPGMLGAISGAECSGCMVGRWNKKQKEGHVDHRLYTWTYLEELSRHYELTNLEYHELWYAKRETGDFKPFIEKCYVAKQTMKETGRKEWAEYHMNKLFMNGGIHGKTITKTNRQKKTYFEGVEEISWETGDPKLNYMVGFTAMQNARERLLRHCRLLIEAGHHIMMCDTDSIVVDCDPQEVQRVLGDWFVHGGPQMEGNLGRFEIEGTCDEFKCWGLKRYVEVSHVGNPPHRRLVRTAFAGMHHEGQARLLNLPTDGTEFEWEQTGKRTLKYGANIMSVVKHAKAETVWDTGPVVAPPYDPNKVVDLTPLRKFCRMVKEHDGEI